MRNEHPSRLPKFFGAASLATVMVSLPAWAGGGPSIRQFIQMRWPVSARLSPDGGLYFLHNPDGLNQLYVRPADGREAVKLTDFPDGVAGYSPSEDGRWIVVSAGVGGNEQYGLYLQEAGKPRVRALFVHPNVVYESVVWRRDSKAFAFRANDTSPADFHIYIYDLANNTATKVLGEAGSWSPEDFTSDGKRLMVTKYTSASYSQLFEIDLAAKTRREITPIQEQWSFAGIGYTQDDKHFIAASDYKADKTACVTIDVVGGVITRPFPQWDAHELDGGSFNEDRSALALSLNEGGYRTAHLYAMPDKKEIPLPPMDRGLVSNIDFCGKHMLYALDNARTPGLIHKWSWAEPASKPQVLTQADTQGIDVSQFPLPELVTYESFDGLKVPAFLYLPKGFQAGQKIPFVIQFHGGPEGQYRPTFDRTIQYLVSRGFGALAPNVRGSSGYGKKYLEMDNYKERMASVKDGIAGAKWLVEKGYSTPAQTGVYGGSYGGFMVMAAITEAPEMFGAACNVVGIVNFQTFLERTKDYRRKLREVEYGPLSDPEFLKSVSPIYKADRIRCPLLIAHGDNDPRVPIHEARQLYDALKKLERPVEIITFADEGHGFRKEPNRIAFAEKLAAFFEKHLAGGTSASPATE